MPRRARIHQQAVCYVLGKSDGLAEVDLRYDAGGLSAGEREAYGAMMRDEADERRMEGQRGLAIGVARFVQRFSISEERMRLRSGPDRRRARSRTEVL